MYNLNWSDDIINSFDQTCAYTVTIITIAIWLTINERHIQILEMLKCEKKII